MKLSLVITAGYRTMDRNLTGNSSLFNKNMGVNEHERLYIQHYAQTQTKVAEYDSHYCSTFHSNSRVFKPLAISDLYYGTTTLTNVLFIAQLLQILVTPIRVKMVETVFHLRLLTSVFANQITLDRIVR